MDGIVRNIRHFLSYTQWPHPLQAFCTTWTAILSDAMPDSQKPVYVLRQTCLKRYKMKLSNIDGAWEASGKASLFLSVTPTTKNIGLMGICRLFTDVRKATRNTGAMCWRAPDVREIVTGDVKKLQSAVQTVEMLSIQG